MCVCLPPSPFFEQVCFVLGSHAGGARLAFARMRALRKENRKEFFSSRPSSADIEDKSYSFPPSSIVSLSRAAAATTYYSGRKVGWRREFPFSFFFLLKRNGKVHSEKKGRRKEEVSRRQNLLRRRGREKNSWRRDSGACVYGRQG